MPEGGTAVGVEIVRLVEFPDLVPQGVLDRVPALLAEAVGPDVPVIDDVVRRVAKPGQHSVHVGRPRLAVVVGAALSSDGGADVADPQCPL